MPGMKHIGFSPTRQDGRGGKGGGEGGGYCVRLLFTHAKLSATAAHRGGVTVVNFGSLNHLFAVG